MAHAIDLVIRNSLSAQLLIKVLCIGALEREEVMASRGPNMFNVEVTVICLIFVLHLPYLIIY